MAEIVGRKNPITPEMRRILKDLPPFQLNQLIDNQIKRSGKGHWAKTRLIQNLMIDDTYKGEHLLYQYIENPRGEIPITRYTKEGEKGFVAPYTDYIQAQVPGVDSDTYQLMSDMWNVSREQLGEKIFGQKTLKRFFGRDVSEKNYVENLLQEEWNQWSNLYTNSKINLSAKNGFFKVGYLFYQRAREQGNDFRASEVTDKLIRSAYYLGSAPGNPDKPIKIPKIFLSPHGSYENDQVFEALNELRNNLDPYLEDKILETIASDEGSNIKIYLDSALNNEGMAIWSTNLNISGAPHVKEGIIPWNVVGDHITFQAKMAMLHDLDYWFKSGQYESFFEWVQDFENQVWKEDRKMILQRTLYQTSPRFAPGIYGPLQKSKINKMFSETNLFDPMFEINVTGNALRAFFSGTNDTVIGLTERDVITRFMSMIKSNSSNEEIENALNKIRTDLASDMVSSVSEVELMSDGIKKYYEKKIIPKVSLMKDWDLIQPRRPEK